MDLVSKGLSMISRPTGSDLDVIAQQLGWFHLTDDERGEYVEMADKVLGVIDLVDSAQEMFESINSVIPANRAAGRRPEPSEDPLNAIVRWCSVRANEPGDDLRDMRLAIKDSVAIAGIPMTLGSATFQDFTPTIDSVVTERLLQAGAHIVATANLDAFAFSGGADTSDNGWTSNPHDPERSAGGSSGGSAAGLFYHEVIDAAIGCDQGGSIRLPSAWCGVVGLKPTHGLVPYTGIGGIDQTFDHAGPITRTVLDAARLLAVIAGAHPSDPRQVSTPKWNGKELLDRVSQAMNAKNLSGVKIGIMSEGFSRDDDLRAGNSDAVLNFANKLKDVGATVVDVSVPAHSFAGGIAFAGFIEGMHAGLRGGGNGFHWKGTYWPEFGQQVADALVKRGQLLPAQIKVVALVGEHLGRLHGGSIYARAQNQRPGLMRAYDNALDVVDFLLTPTAPYPAFRLHDELSLGERVMRGWEPLSNCAPSDMSGHPAISLPTASLDGLPVGAMLIAKRFSDTSLLELSAKIEHLIGWDSCTRERLKQTMGPNTHPTIN